MKNGLVVLAVLIVVFAAAGFTAVYNTMQVLDDKYLAEKSFKAFATEANIVMNGQVGLKHIVPVQLPAKSKIILSNEIENGAPRGRIDMELSNGNKLTETIPLPINFVAQDRKDTGRMTLTLDKQLNIDTSVSPQIEVFFPEGEYKFILVHRSADYTSWSNNGIDYLEISQD